MARNMYWFGEELATTRMPVKVTIIRDRSALLERSNCSSHDNMRS
jgi:hypothetical protein